MSSNPSEQAGNTTPSPHTHLHELLDRNPNLYVYRTSVGDLGAWEANPGAGRRRSYDILPIYDQRTDQITDMHIATAEWPMESTDQVAAYSHIHLRPEGDNHFIVTHGELEEGVDVQEAIAVTRKALQVFDAYQAVPVAERFMFQTRIQDSDPATRIGRFVTKRTAQSTQTSSPALPPRMQALKIFMDRSELHPAP